MEAIDFAGRRPTIHNGENAMRPSVLILSTTPPYPREYGNRNRVFQTWKFFEERGFEVSFLLYPFDTEWTDSIPDYYKSLQKSFFYFDVISNSKRLHKAAEGFHHDIDEWWDDNIAVELDWLSKRKRFDVVFVNYTFLSKAFDFFDKKTLKILDTHDLFTGRREAFEANGVEPEFFYTSESEEKVAFDRADIVIGIKKDEAVFMEQISTANVICIPYWPDLKTVQDLKLSVSKTSDVHTPLRAGFIGAQNSVNTVNMKRFIDRFAGHPMVDRGLIKIIVAGNVCKRLSAPGEWIELAGRVERIEDFYDEIDVVIAPLDFSTGIKIKVAEALSFGKPVVSTANAFDGFKVNHSAQCLPDQDAVCNALIQLATGELNYEELKTAAEASAQAAAMDASEGFNALSSLIFENVSRIFCIIDRPFWYRACLIDEYIAQTIEYLSHLGRVCVVYCGAEKFIPENIFCPVDFIQIDIAELTDKMNELQTFFSAKAVFDCLKSGLLDEVNELFVPPPSRGIWKVRFDAVQIEDQLSLGFEMRSQGTFLGALPLRYFPIYFQRDLRPKQYTDYILFVRERATRADEAILSVLNSAAENMNKTVGIVRVVEFSEYSSDFFNKIGPKDTSAAFFIGSVGVDWIFIKNLFMFKKTPVARLGADLLEDGFLDEAERGDLKGHLVGRMQEIVSASTFTVEMNNGWDELWSALA